jgi:CheY-like chemotaxis protein
MEAVGQLTGGIAHDFNNLLTVVIGNLGLIADRVEDPVTGRMAQSAINSARRGAELTQRLLAFSRKQTLAPSVIELDQLVAGLTELMRRTLGESIEIEVVGADDVWTCRADHAQLESTILNLALNARDAMPLGGKLTIETSNVKLVDADVAALNDVSPGEFVKASVSDTGTGMSQDVIDHAFEPFFTTKDVGAGSGLGLSMVHGFINQSGGFVTIDSTEDVGTTVNLYLPRSLETTPTVLESPKGKSPVSRGEKVLVVEDDPDVRVLTVHLLLELGYETVEAADGKEAIEVLQQTPGIDLLFTDVGLPGGMSGIDIAREALQQFPNIKVLFTSGYGDDVLTRHGGIDADAEFVRKPFSKEDLAQKLRTVMGLSIH